ncbi:hypothetical protein SAMN05444401_3538 [Clostridium amylolyticum]|uniref:Uncharacterized protein n=1 Tax=Clostridium amylolyticum TaxID=1121298 RepID=A0A1M6KYC6_9CLOT|nr:hypothetical protein [Clostridium amylolyticum]SHJ63862.1 hypothetical protein SAMN05444401_3538 [Clostridium amylolyticum]
MAINTQEQLLKYINELDESNIKIINTRNAFTKVDVNNDSKAIVSNIKGRTLKNEVVNGGFTNGVAGWRTSGGTLTNDGQTGVLLATAKYARADQQIKKKETDKVYISAYIKSTSNLVHLMAGDMVNHTGSGQYERLSGISSVNSTNAYVQIRDFRDSGWDNIYIKEVIAVNLTMLFGAGKEPTLEWCKENIRWFDGVKSVGEQEGNKILVKSVGKNLFDINKPRQFVNGDIVIDNSLKIYTQRTYNKGTYYDFKLKPNTKYTFKHEFTVNGNAVTNYTTIRNTVDDSIIKRFETNISPQSYTFITPSNGLISIEFARMGGGADLLGWLIITNIQLEEGEQATPYEVYKSKKLEMQLSEPLRGRYFAQDEIIYGKVTRKIGKIILNGSEAWAFNASNTDTVSFATVIIREKAKINQRNGTNPIADTIPSSTIGVYTDDIEGVFIDSAAGMSINILKSKLATPDVTGFKAWLQANPTTIYYELKTPTEAQTAFYNAIDVYKNGSIVLENNIIPDISVNILNIAQRLSSAESNIESLDIDLYGLQGQVTEIIDELSTKAVIESGIVGNGRFVKFSDGTMVCYGNNDYGTNMSTAEGAFYKSDEITWNFPATFAPYTVPVCAIIPKSSDSICFAQPMVGGSNSSVKFKLISTKNTFTTVTVNFIAFGRWN